MHSDSDETLEAPNTNPNSTNGQWCGWPQNEMGEKCATNCGYLLNRDEPEHDKLTILSTKCARNNIPFMDGSVSPKTINCANYGIFPATAAHEAKKFRSALFITPPEYSTIIPPDCEKDCPEGASCVAEHTFSGVKHSYCVGKGEDAQFPPTAVVEPYNPADTIRGDQLGTTMAKPFCAAPAAHWNMQCELDSTGCTNGVLPRCKEANQTCYKDAKPEQCCPGLTCNGRGDAGICVKK